MKVLIPLTIALLRLLSKMDKKRIWNVEFRQGRETLVTQDGIPADRSGWVYLPFLRGYSKEFQPPTDDSGRKIYREYFPEGSALALRTGGEDKPLLVSQRQASVIIERDAFVKGFVVMH